MQLPSKIKGWLTTKASPEQLMKSYLATQENHYVEQLVELFNSALFHYLASQIERSLAEDLLQQTWLTVIKTTELANKNASIKSWLFTIARNKLIDELRRQQRWQYVEHDHELPTSYLEQQIDLRDRLALFNLAVESLSFHQREAFIFQQEGFSIAEICQLTNEHFETIKSRLRYARNNIKRVLEAQS